MKPGPWILDAVIRVELNSLGDPRTKVCNSNRDRELVTGQAVWIDNTMSQLVSRGPCPETLDRLVYNLSCVSCYVYVDLTAVVLSLIANVGDTRLRVGGPVVRMTCMTDVNINREVSHRPIC